METATSAPERRLAALVTDWYAEHSRDLPWRAPGVSAWAVLVSEIMLQQTPVNRVLPVWREWLARWPSPQDLAVQPAAEVIRAWGRLGYPRRALRLHECAKALVERHGGAVPRDVEALLALPGIGAYTARAVAVFAYGDRHPVVDTNVRRFVARAVSGLPDAGPPRTVADLAAVEELLPVEAPAAARASVAFMELGALICTARTPRCADCPVYAECGWQRAGRPAGTGPARKAQKFAGTDRQVRGLMMAVLRDATGPVPRAALDAVWQDAAQRERALSGLLDDGLVDRLPYDRYALPS